MPQIRQYVSQAQTGGQVQGGSLSQPVDLSGVIRGAGAFAQASEELRRAQEMTAERMAGDEAKVLVTNTISRAASMWTEKLTAAQTGAPEGAAGFTDGVLKEFDTWAKGATEQAPERGRQYLEQHLSTFRQGLHADAFRFEMKARTEKLGADFLAGVDDDRRTAQGQPSQVLPMIARRLATLSDLDLPAATKATLAQKARETIAFDASASLVNADPAAWLKRDAKDPLVSLLDPTNLRNLNQHAQVRLKQIEGDRAREAAASERLAVDTVQALEKFAIEGRMPSPEYEATSLMLTRGTPWEAQAKDLLERSKAGAMFGSLPLPRQRQALAEAEALPTDPKRAEATKHARTVMETQERAAKEDPWEFGARFHRLPVVDEAQITDASVLPGLVAQRLPLMGKLEAAAGFPVSPLRPGEVAKATQALGGLAIPQRAEALGRLGSMLSVERQQALADQLGKGDDSLGLAFKLNDRTSAGRVVSELVLLGKQALGDKTVKKDDAALSGWKSEIAALVRGTLGDTKAEDEVIRAAYYVRAAQELDSAAAPGFTKGFGKGAEDALTMVVGRPLDRGGVKTLLPRGMDEAQFDTKAREMLAPAKGETVYMRGQPVKIEEVALRLSSYGMRMTRPGEYMPIVNNTPFTVDKEGRQPLRLKVQ